MRVKFTLTFTIEEESIPLTVKEPDLERACIETARALLAAPDAEFQIVKKHYKIAVQQ